MLEQQHSIYSMTEASSIEFYHVCSTILFSNYQHY